MKAFVFYCFWPWPESIPFQPTLLKYWRDHRSFQTLHLATDWNTVLVSNNFLSNLFLCFDFDTMPRPFDGFWNLLNFLLQFYLILGCFRSDFLCTFFLVDFQPWQLSFRYMGGNNWNIWNSGRRKLKNVYLKKCVP